MAAAEREAGAVAQPEIIEMTRKTAENADTDAVDTDLMRICPFLPPVHSNGVSRTIIPDSIPGLTTPSWGR